MTADTDLDSTFYSQDKLDVDLLVSWIEEIHRTSFTGWGFLTTPCMNSGIYDTSSNDTSSTEPFRRKGFLSKCHFVECPLRPNRVSSNTFDEIFYAPLSAILYLLIL